MRIVAFALALALAACAHGSSQSQGDGLKKIKVATTISTLNSFVQAVGGDYVTVNNIVPIGASPETFAPAPQDVASVADAQILVENGAGLETWLDRLLHDAGASKLRIVVCAHGLPVKGVNPHLWMDPVLAKAYVEKIRDALIATDPAHSTAYRVNAFRYNARLDELTAQIQRQINLIPLSQRYMIVYHNAWQYYNDRFGITTLGFVERNPGQEPNPQQIAQLIDLAKQHHVKALFSEPEYSPKILETMAQGAGINIVENLYDDSVGTNPQVANYIAMLTYDTNVIVQSLK
ncbi:MAG TPA: metal ABC transporter substrate-binding protein [Candidatus Cybelea sp.]|jgi:manganese/iron transport system substrate-binding protein|nr:metal ABC transporter substrate-binding protein [Candidatus Cybelea sp.]